MIGLAARPDLREECMLNQTGMVLNYAKYAPETTPLLSWRRRTACYSPTRQNSCTVHKAERMNSQKKWKTVITLPSTQLIQTFWNRFRFLISLSTENTSEADIIWECYKETRKHSESGNYIEEQLKQ